MNAIKALALAQAKGGRLEVEALSVSQNGVYTADEGKPASPPTVNNANAFSGLPTDCVIYVPTGKLADYTSAQNYPSSATYTYAEE